MKETLRILHVSLQKDWRGGEQQAIYLFEEGIKMQYLQWVLCSEGNAMEEFCVLNGYPYYSIKSSFIKNFSNQKQLQDICEKHKIDIIHVHDSKAHTLAFLSCRFGNITPVVVSRRVDFPVRKSIFSKQKYNCVCIKKFICISHKIKEILEPDIEDTSKLTVIHSGIDISKFNGCFNKGILRKEFNIPDDEIIIGNVAAIADHKDYFTFVDTAGILLSKTDFKAKFLIIGDGPLRFEIEKYINSKNLSKHIIFTGFRNDIPDILPELDIFLFTSKTEGLGTSILDAMACGVAVVSTNAGGIPEIIKHEFNGMMSETGNADDLAQNIEKLLANNYLKQHLINNAKQTVLKFTKEYMAEQNFKIYRDVYFSGQ